MLGDNTYSDVLMGPAFNEFFILYEHVITLENNKPVYETREYDVRQRYEHALIRRTYEDPEMMIEYLACARTVIEANKVDKVLFGELLNMQILEDDYENLPFAKQGVVCAVYTKEDDKERWYGIMRSAVAIRTTKVLTELKARAKVSKALLEQVAK